MVKSAERAMLDDQREEVDPSRQPQTSEGGCRRRQHANVRESPVNVDNAEVKQMSKFQPPYGEQRCPTSRFLREECFS
jgi:hypothetical protein